MVMHRLGFDVIFLMGYALPIKTKGGNTAYEKQGSEQLAGYTGF